jgi:hypothetical protein
MGENVSWLLSHLGEAFTDRISAAVLAGVSIAFLLSILGQLRTGAPIPWRWLAAGIVIAPAMLLVSLVLSVPTDRSDSLAIVGLVLVSGILVAQLVCSAILVWRAPGSRIVLGSWLLVGWWLTFIVSGVAIGLATGMGRTWR